MRVYEKRQLTHSLLFTQTNQVKGYTKFVELESELDEQIFYADMNKEVVLNAVKEEFNAKPFELLFFDNIYVALLTK